MHKDETFFENENTVIDRKDVIAEIKVSNYFAFNVVFS